MGRGGDGEDGVTRNARGTGAVPIDKDREAIQRRELEIAITSLMREEAVVNYYASKGYIVLSQTDDETRRVFGIPRGVKAADIVVEVSTGRAIVAEVKGTDLDTALEQLENTVNVVRRRYPSIACKVFVKNPTPAGDAVDLRGGHYGYRAMRILYNSFPAEWLLMEYQEDGSATFVELGSEVVGIVFGPHV